MPLVGGTLLRYFGMRFLSAVLLTFVGVFALITLIDYIEMMRRVGDNTHVSALLVAKISFFRVPQISERLMPFCVLIGAMSCYLNLSRRLELVIARAAGMSAWQFISPAVIVAFLLGRIRHRRLQPPIRRHAGALEALRSRAIRPENVRLHERRRLLAQSTRRRRPSHHQRQIQPRPGHDPKRRFGIQVRHCGPFRPAHRGARRRAGAGCLAADAARASTASTPWPSISPSIGSKPA